MAETCDGCCQRPCICTTISLPKAEFDQSINCGSNAADWCLAPNGVECANHDENGDRRA